MIRIKILKSCAGIDPLREGRPYNYNRGQIVTVPDHIAYDLVKSGIAQLDDSDPEAPPPRSAAVVPKIERDQVMNAIVKRRHK